MRANNYHDEVIITGIRKAKELTVEQLRSTKQKTNDKVLPLVITHNPNNPPVVNAVKEHLKFLPNSTEMKPLLDNTKLIVADKPQNLENILTKAAFSEQRPNEPRCGTCDNIITGDSITLESGKTWNIKSPMYSKHIARCSNGNHANFKM